MSLDFLENLSSDYENALVLTGFGKFHLLLLTICGLIYLNTAIGVTILSFVLPSATCDFQMTSQDKGWLSASPMLGMLLGSYFWGCLADTKGRKIVLIATLIADGICGLLSSIAPYYLMFLCIRFFNGFNVAGAMGIVFPYLGEFQPTKYREKILCWMELFWTFGIIILPGIAWLVIPVVIHLESDVFFYHSWNLFVAICAIPRHKSRMELVRVSAAVMGIEFSYAAETAFVSPTLLKIGVEHQHMTLVWALSPLVGFFLTPILGSMSDRCKLNMGRRRPFIILLSIGVFLGLLLVPNGEDLGYLFGDIDPHIQISAMNLTLNGTTHNNINVSPHRATASKTELGTIQKTSHPWGIFFTVLGTVLLDFDADACQSPSRAYLLDVCVPDDHAKGLSTFTIMAGLGGFMGYSMGGINWDDTSLGRRLGGHVKAVFTIITFIFIACVTFTVTSFKEIPLWALAPSKSSKSARTETDHLQDGAINYGTLENTEYNASELNENPFDKLTSNDVQQQSDYFKSNADENEIGETSFMATDGIQQQEEIYPNINDSENVAAEQPVENLSHYLLSIVYMPHSLRMVCLTNLFCWMAHVCYSLYFTDFVGEAVFNGDPKALEGSQAQILYEEGVRFGCWGMAMYSLSCACYSFVIEKLIQRFKAKNVYVGGLLFYCTGMSLMALTRAKASVIIFSWAAGVMYSTLFTMPYLLVAHYHSMGTFELDVDGTAKLGSSVRGLGTDVAIVSSMVFLAQFILSICMGTIVSVSGTTTAVVSTASFLSFCGAISATQIMYLDL